MADVFAGNVMDLCCYCGKEFEKKAKGYQRSSLSSNIRVRQFEKSLKEVIEEEFGVTLTPEQKTKHFLCSTCSSSLMTLARSKKSGNEALSKLKSTATGTSYLSKKINVRSPFPTPRKVKRPRIRSPVKAKDIQVPVTATTSWTLVSSKTRKKKKTSGIYQPLEITRALRYISRRQYLRGINLLMICRSGFQKALNEVFANKVRQEVSQMAKQKIDTFRGGQSLQEIAQFDWNEQFQSVSDKSPTLTSTLVAALTSKQSKEYLGLASKPDVSAKPIIGTLLSIILYQRRPRNLTGFQELNSLQMWLAGCKREMFARFNHLGLCLGIDATRTSLDRIRRGFDDKVLKWKTDIADYLLLPSDTSTSQTIPYCDDADDSEKTIPLSRESSPPSSPLVMDENLSPQRQPTSTDESISKSSQTVHTGRFGFSICFDNVNQKLTVRHQTRDRNNKILNMVQAYAAKDRIASIHLDDSIPSPQNILNMPLGCYLPSEMDEIDLRSEITTMVTRTLCQFVPAFHCLEDEVNWNIDHPYSKESSQKSECVPLGVIDKDECKVADMIDIMEAYHKYVPVKPDGNPFILPLHADGLSCERGDNAQSARINGTTAWLQLQGLTMNIQEWHKRCLLLQDAFDELYIGSSSREKGTLFYIKNYFNHRNVTNNVKEAFNYDEEFLQFCTDSYIVLAGMHCMDIAEINETPDDFPLTKDEKLRYLHHISSLIVDMLYISSQPMVQKILQTEEPSNETYPICICKEDIAGADMIFCHNRNCPNGVWFHLECFDMTPDDVPDGKWYCSDSCKKQKGTRKKRKTVVENLLDGKRNYALLVMWRGLNQRVRQDAIRENDGNRIILHWKFDMLQYIQKHHPKYFLIGHRLLSALHGALSKRLQHVLRWNRTVNPNGGRGKNIAMDLQMEFFNKKYKESVKDAAGQLTEATIARHSQMVGVGKIIRAVYEKQVSGLSRPLVHSTTPTDRSKDVQEFTKLMIEEDIFVIKPGRKHASFPDMDLLLYSKIIPKNFKSRLVRIRKEMSDRRKLVKQMQQN